MSDWDVVTMELQLHARRNQEFAQRFYALEERLTKFYAEILAERFAQAGRKPPLDPRSLSYARLRLELENSSVYARSRQRSRPDNSRIARPDAGASPRVVRFLSEEDQEQGEDRPG